MDDYRSSTFDTKDFTASLAYPQLVTRPLYGRIGGCIGNIVKSCKCRRRARPQAVTACFICRFLVVALNTMEAKQYKS
jgi:hypothetical protein